MRSIIIWLSLIGLISVGGTQAQEPVINFLEVGTVNQCEGPDTANYTYVNLYHYNSNCVDGYVNDPTYLIACSPTGEEKVVALQTLAESDYPAGAYGQYEALFLCLSGPLAGKYAYIKEIYQKEAYLKKCSSVLGYSYVSTKSLVLLIAESLNVNMFTYPGGAYDIVKKASSTICTGGSYTV